MRLRAAAGLLTLAGVLLAAAPASAASSEANFDPPAVEAGALVSGQYESLGLTLGLAQSLGLKAPPEHTEGNCGAPTAEAGALAASAPNYARLPSCPGGLPVSGTFGRLAPARGSVAVLVRTQDAAAGPGTVVLSGYDASGTSVVKATVEVVSTEWRRVAIEAPAPTIAYFRVLATVTPSPVLIDNLSFEARAEPGGGGGTETTPPPAPSPPTAAIAPVGAAVAGGLTSLTAAGSTPGHGRIIAYDWDLSGDGHIDTSTGTNPLVRLVLAPGLHTIGLTVTNSNHESSSTRFGLLVPGGSSLHLPDGGEGPCMQTLQVGDAQMIGECIQAHGSGGYAIATRQLAINGMLLTPTGGGTAVFQIATVKDFAIAGTRTLLSGPAVNVELLNTPIGDVVLGGRDLQAEPITLESHSGLAGLKIPYYHAPRARSAETPSRTLLMAIGVGHECTGTESKKAGCCPASHENTACATLPGSFPLVGQVAVYLNNKGQSLFDVQVGLELKGIFEATGALEIEADPQSGVNLNSLKFEVPEAGLEGIFTVKKAKFAYYFPSAPDESKRDTWQAEGEIVFGPLGEPSLEAELSFRKGQFHSGSLVFGAPPPGIPVYPGVFLNKLGGSIGVEPFSFGGVLGAKVAAALELTLSFKYREASGQELGFFGGQGQLELDDSKIATLAADVYSDGYIDAQLAIDLHLPFSSESPVVKVGGNIGFWDEPASGKWQAEGTVYLKLWEISAEVGALVNDQYIAGCASALGFGVQGRYRFSDGNVDGGLFGASNCSDQLKQYQEKPLVKHSGGFVGESLLPRAPVRSRPGLRARPRAFGAAEGATFTLPSGRDGEELRFTGAGGTPVLKLIAPDGTVLPTAPGPGHIEAIAGRYISAVAPDRSQVLVLLAHPAGGTWRVQTVAGSPALVKLEAAEDVPAPRIRARAGRRGSGWGLSWSARGLAPGYSILFVERGRDSTHVIGRASGTKGLLAFHPQDALSRARRLYAYLLDPSGAPVRSLQVGSYRAPAATRGGRVGGLRVVRRGLTALVTWRAAPGARSYRVRVHGSDGRLLTLLRAAGRRSVLLTGVLPFERLSVSVQARGGPNLLPGPAAAVSLAAQRPPRRR